jgi:hypothetical protein
LDQNKGSAGISVVCVGSEHLLLGLLREKEGVAAHVLMNLRLNVEKVRKEVLNLLGRDVKEEKLVQSQLCHLPAGGADGSGVLEYMPIG